MAYSRAQLRRRVKVQLPKRRPGDDGSPLVGSSSKPSGPDLEPAPAAASAWRGPQAASGL